MLHFFGMMFCPGLADVVCSETMGSGGSEGFHSQKITEDEAWGHLEDLDSKPA